MCAVAQNRFPVIMKLLIVESLVTTICQPHPEFASAWNCLFCTPIVTWRWKLMKITSFFSFIHSEIVPSLNSNFIFVKICSFISFPQSLWMGFFFSSFYSPVIFSHMKFYVDICMESTFRMKNTIHSYCYFCVWGRGMSRKRFLLPLLWRKKMFTSRFSCEKIVTWTSGIYKRGRTKLWECIEFEKSSSKISFRIEIEKVIVFVYLFNPLKIPWGLNTNRFSQFSVEILRLTSVSVRDLDKLFTMKIFYKIFWLSHENFKLFITPKWGEGGRNPRKAQEGFIIEKSSQRVSCLEGERNGSF